MPNSKPRPEITALAIGRRVKIAMKRAKINQTILAARIGSHKPEISNLIHGKNMPSIPFLKRIAEVLGVRVRDLIEPDREWAGVEELDREIRE
jgi:transcriptional regulator with XRE-family HTH domain